MCVANYWNICWNQEGATRKTVKTGLGISDASYKQKFGKPEVDGEVQGTTDTPSIFTMQTDVVMKAHTSISDSLNIDSCNMT